MAQAVDYSWGRPSPQSIRQAGYEGALRYLGPGNGGRDITVAEKDRLMAAGLSLGLVWETTTGMMLRGAEGGRQDAPLALRHAQGLGFTSGVIYFACDTEVSGSQLAIVEAYWRAAEEVLPDGWVAGVYGQYTVAEHLASKGCRYLWQCAAWSGNGNGSGGQIQGRRRSEHACLFQRVGYVLGNTCDHNDVLRADWGQWFPGGARPDQTTPQQEDDPVTQDDIDKVVAGVVAALKPQLSPNDDMADGSKGLRSRVDQAIVDIKAHDDHLTEQTHPNDPRGGRSLRNVADDIRAQQPNPPA